jgi:hypothetical protein
VLALVVVKALLVMQKRKGEGKGRIRKGYRGVNMIKMHCMYAWGCYNKAPNLVQLKYTN